MRFRSSSRKGGKKEQRISGVAFEDALEASRLTGRAFVFADGDVGVAPCPSMDFTCDDGSCIPKSSVCDGLDDCLRAEDELHCDRECTPTQFKCVTGNKCIDGIYRCDDHPDCPDQSDEDCAATANETITRTSSPTSTPSSLCVSIAFPSAKIAGGAARKPACMRASALRLCHERAAVFHPSWGPSAWERRLYTP
ncbi:hypothetical protein KM043_012788 [Ampulex compressa]|nr:hypothetical protein KM043_012788 [Ampulex compressa]